ncbi:MAG: serine hydrolase domain-containing protein [Cryomorphaceae bacterium]
MRLALFSLLILLSGCQGNSDSANIKATKSIPDVKTREELKSLADSAFAAEMPEGEPGGAYMVAYNGRILFAESFGLQVNSSKVPVSLNTNFRVAAVSMQFTALAALTLVDEGKLSLGDPVNEILGITSMPGVKVGHLIHHTSGIPSYESYFVNDWKGGVIPTNKDVLQWYAENGKPKFQPGTEFEFSNGGYNLLATVVEKASGMDFMVYANKAVFEPAGMKTSTYYSLSQPVPVQNQAFGYTRNNGEWMQTDGNKLNGLVGEDGVYTSINNYFLYDLALRRKTILSESVHDFVFERGTEKIPNFPGTLDFINLDEVYYGKGWFLSNDIAFHSGKWQGTSALTIRELNRPLTIAIFRNTGNDSDHLANYLYALVNSYFENWDDVE